MSEPKEYEGREQTYVKHLILKKYLERFARIVAWGRPSITYVDCFSGPWQDKSEKHEDTSFAIAIRELCRAQETLKEQRIELRLRCFFIEKDREAYGRLDHAARSFTNVKIETRNLEFADAIPDILAFVKKGVGTFPFIFIDPTGWTGFGMETIKPLLQINPCEVLVNFMTGHILRFIETEGTAASIEQLFGEPGVQALVAGATGQEREDILVTEYRACLGRAGNFAHTCSAIVLHRRDDRTQFNLIYATRHPKGVEVFKGAERQVMDEMEKVRAEAQQRARQDKSGQGELFPGQEMPHSPYYEGLRRRYGTKAKEAVQRLLEQKRRLPYDEAWYEALKYSLVWDSDLKKWIKDWGENGFLKVEGLAPRQRVPQHGKNHSLVWISPAGKG